MHLAQELPYPRFRIALSVQFPVDPSAIVRYDISITNDGINLLYSDKEGLYG